MHIYPPLLTFRNDLGGRARLSDLANELWKLNGANQSNFKRSEASEVKMHGDTRLLG
jgi:hypothetical protein